MWWQLFPFESFCELNCNSSNDQMGEKPKVIIFDLGIAKIIVTK